MANGEIADNGTDEKLKRFFTRLLQEAIAGKADNIRFKEGADELFVEVRRQDTIYKNSSMKLSWFDKVETWLKLHRVESKRRASSASIDDGWPTRVICLDTPLEFNVQSILGPNNRRILHLIGIGAAQAAVASPIIGDQPGETLSVAGDFFVDDSELKKVVKTKPLVMIVEDDKDQRGIIELVLKDNDYEVVVAEDGIEALRILGRVRPDLIISDLMMPNLDGTELVKRLKSDKRLSKIPVLILTVLSDMEKEYKLLALGVDDYCEKTVQRNILLKRVENLIRRSKT